MKTTTSKTRFLSRLLTAVLFLSATSTAFGQEVIRAIRNAPMSDSSIIRQVTKDTVLISNNFWPKSTFMMLSNSIANAPTIYIDPIFVNDFEIDDKTVYFCGYLLENEKRAVYGCFDLHTFPFCTISYYEIPECTELRKIDFYTIGDMFNSETHFVMTGSTGTRSDALIDVPHTLSPTFNGLAYFSTNEYESIDDVAVIDNYVVVSARDNEYGIPIVNFWQYTKPSSFGTSIFNTSVNRVRVSNPSAGSPVFLEHKGSDDYSAVYKDDVFPRIDMLELSWGATVIKALAISADSTRYPLDIKYHNSTLVYDILARDEGDITIPYFNPKTKVYHVTPSVLNNTVTNGEGTWYPNRHMWSIDPLGSWAPRFVASGEYMGMVKFFKYSHNQWEYCPERFEFKYENGMITKNVKDSPLPKTSVIYLYLEEKEPYYKEYIPFPQECPAK